MFCQPSHTYSKRRCALMHARSNSPAAPPGASWPEWRRSPRAGGCRQPTPQPLWPIPRRKTPSRRPSPPMRTSDGEGEKALLLQRKTGERRLREGGWVSEKPPPPHPSISPTPPSLHPSSPFPSPIPPSLTCTRRGSTQCGRSLGRARSPHPGSHPTEGLRGQRRGERRGHCPGERLP
jgi:hypothetical protein